MKVILIISYILVIIGALNWGAVGLFQVNPVEMLLGSMPMLLRTIYGLIGLAGIILLFSCKHWCYRCSHE